MTLDLKCGIEFLAEFEVTRNSEGGLEPPELVWVGSPVNKLYEWGQIEPEEQKALMNYAAKQFSA